MCGDLPAAKLGICEAAFRGIALAVPMAANIGIAWPAEINHAVASAVIDLGAVNKLGALPAIWAIDFFHSEYLALASGVSVSIPSSLASSIVPSSRWENSFESIHEDRL